MKPHLPIGHIHFDGKIAQEIEAENSVMPRLTGPIGKNDHGMRFADAPDCVQAGRLAKG